ncbi:hypothetical protein B0H14DRAFT_3607480 [Mycena olivaceomarginata]|nr:hypothetical protein B0H14DRAFT_3607480 [Mycena olivaceomarginata]
MSTYASSVSSFATRMATPRRSYASVVAAGLGVTVVSESSACFEERSFSMAELNTGSIELPRWHAHVDDPVATEHNSVPAFHVAGGIERGVGARLDECARATRRAIGFERRAAMPLEARNVSETSTRPTPLYLDAPHSSTQNALASWPFPPTPNLLRAASGAVYPRHPTDTRTQMKLTILRISLRYPSLPYRERPWKDFGLRTGRTGHSRGPPPLSLPRRLWSVARNLVGAILRTIRGVLAGGRSPRAGGKELREEDESSDGWSLQAMRHRMMRVRSRLYAALPRYASRTPAEVATGLRGLPAAVQVKPAYPTQVWKAMVSSLEKQSETDEETG